MLELIEPISDGCAIEGERSHKQLPTFLDFQTHLTIQKQESNHRSVLHFLHSHNKLKLAHFQQLLKQKYTMNLPETLTVVV
jgi:hypothetical protein